ncbi:MAG TPA: thioredoxin family protein [Terriglobales bacterium]|nr:thioredoxin family protein [Terriglobales bacterium]
MRSARVLFTFVFALLLVAPSLLAQQAPLTQDQVSARLRQLYPAGADAKKDITDAIAAAAKEHKRVLLVFGADWCFDCFALDYRFHQSAIEPLVDKNYEVVHVDIGRGERNVDLIKKYRIPIEKGVPSVAVLDGKGHLLYSTGQFESARRTDPQVIVHFLETWKPV